MSAVTGSRLNNGHAVPTKSRGRTADQELVALPIQARRHTWARSHQGQRRRVHGMEIGGNLLAHRRVEPGRGLAERPAQQRAKPLWRGQLPLAVMDEERHAASALVGLERVRQDVRPGADLRAGAGEVVDAGDGAAARPRASPARRPSRVGPTTAPAPEAHVAGVEKRTPGQHRGGPARAHRRAELSPDLRRAPPDARVRA